MLTKRKIPKKGKVKATTHYKIQQHEEGFLAQFGWRGYDGNWYHGTSRWYKRKITTKCLNRVFGRKNKGVAV